MKINAIRPNSANPRQIKDAGLAVRHNNKCRMMELDPHYCDVIIARLEKLTGNKAVKISKP